MIFSSPRFFVFLAAVLAVLALPSRHETKKRILFVASCVFYAAWDYRYLALLLLVSVIDYYCAARIAATDDRRVRHRWVVFSVASNLGILGYFKYYNFVIGNLNGLVAWTGVSLPVLSILLPAGISYYTFKSMSYTIDVYRREIEPCQSLMDYATFVTFFPELIAGPIVRASIFLPQMTRRIGPTVDRFAVGASLFLLGLTKKVVIADRLAAPVDQVFARPALFSAPTLWLAAVGYSLQIYCDFSGYSDMAIGTAKMIGYDLPENFNMPYVARSITEFWRRWHMTLSSWLRDYVYIPLGGNRKGTRRRYNPRACGRDLRRQKGPVPGSAAGVFDRPRSAQLVGEPVRRASQRAGQSPGRDANPSGVWRRLAPVGHEKSVRFVNGTAPRSPQASPC